jgi:hypothetical protein
VKVILAWAALNAALALLLTLWWQKPLPNGLFWAAVVVIVALALVAWRPHEPRARVVPELSVSTIVLAFGIAGLIAGSTFGDWNFFLSGLVTLVGLAGLARELAVQRRRR